MRVRAIEMNSFMSHEATSLELPDTGIFLFTGLNGAGKSSFAEAVSMAFWGKTLRGKPPWPRDTKEGSVHVLTDVVDAKRTLVRGKTDKVTLDWNPLDDQNFPGESTSKTQKALERIVGDHATWRHACVFSSSDAMLFSKASDMDRKKLIESVLGLGRFEQAYRACKAAILEKDKEARTYREQVLVAGQVLAVLEQRLVEHNEALASQPAPVAQKDRDQVAKLNKLLTATQLELSEMQKQLKASQQAIGRADASASSATRTYKDWSGKANCHTCTQPVSKGLLAKLKQAMEEAVSSAEQARHEASAQLSQVEQSYQELEDEYQILQDKRDKLHEKIVLSDNAALQRTRIEKQIAQAEQDLDAKRAELQQAQGALAPLEAELEDLRMAEQVLHYRGVRAQILSETLEGLEALTNVALAELDDKIRIRIKSYTETKTAGVNDAISIEVDGAGDGYGYDATSGGERRRIDVAFLFAIIQIAEAANGRHGDALWLDEVFDGLDDEVVPRLGAMLSAIAAQRQVFIISHAKAVKTLLPITHHFEVVDGTVKEAA